MFTFLIFPVVKAGVTLLRIRFHCSPCTNDILFAIIESFADFDVLSMPNYKMLHIVFFNSKVVTLP